MSQDQKPGRVRMLAGGGAGSTGTPGPLADSTTVATAGAPGGDVAAKGDRRAGLLPVLLFMAGCIGGGVAVARLGPL
ncbi:hypothetical protein [Sphingomonas mollis]|uniref:Uncharacterized protein n=1 Tax=Sphingomonas mollis TaxID=2795726 RepID=A0ABS0XSI6_9SPHN|nr:hypothetical protein [Sphingomonas sp. BT553]MBJ6123010.1 hypothetical protein [Sphingomonas sp. BT553]